MPMIPNHRTKNLVQADDICEYLGQEMTYERNRLLEENNFDMDVYLKLGKI
jgi:hypothetical protein